ncbi:hypothetical protein DPMN_129252 [Dreissena polymorpha]|uniref:Uncharacterized protein n=1 Tax=Dreissena polymorpha TaxID=45954 RepID=A0A9D4H2E6_DREPO|nr:hypothetical protein DPMN_129252 [Dreissena polymorpha]
MSDMLICYPTQEGRCPPCLTCSSATLHRKVGAVPSMSDMLICYPTQEGRCPPCLTCSSATLHRKVGALHV